MNTRNLGNVVAAALAGIRTNDKDKQNLLFQNGHLYSWSAAIAVSTLLPEDAKNLTGVINGVDLTTFLSKLQVEDIDIDCLPNKWVITAENMSAELNARTDYELADKVAKLTTDYNWKPIPDKFYECLDLCDIPYNVYKVNGVYIGDNMVIATDNRRVNRAYMGEPLDSPVLLSAFSVSEIRKLRVRFTDYSITSKWIHFRCVQDGQEEIVFSCNRLDEKAYENDLYSSFIDKALNNQLAEGKLPKMSGALLLAQCFDNVIETGKGETVNNIISLEFGHKYVTVSSERGTSGKFSQKIPYPEGLTLDIEKPIKVRVTSVFLMEAMTRTTNFAICSVGKKSVILFKGEFFTSAVQVFNE